MTEPTRESPRSHMKTAQERMNENRAGTPKWLIAVITLVVAGAIAAFVLWPK